MLSLSVVLLAVVCRMVVSAQSDSCGRQKDFVELLHELIETKINNTLRDDLERLVKAEVKRIVSGSIDKRIEGKVNKTIHIELEGRVGDHVKTALASEPGEQAKNLFHFDNYVVLQHRNLVMVYPLPPNFYMLW